MISRKKTWKPLKFQHAKGRGQDQIPVKGGKWGVRCPFGVQGWASLPHSQAFPARCSWRDAPSPSWELMLSYLWPSTPSASWKYSRIHVGVASHLSKYPSSEWDQPLLICRNTRKAPPIKRFSWSFKQPELRRTELFNSLNMVQSKFIDNYSENILSCLCGQNHLSKPLISNLRFLLFCYQIPPRKLPRSILKQLRFLLPALCLMEGF